MNDPVHEETYRGYVIRIFFDDCAESPRNWDNLGTMVCWSRRHNLGDEMPKQDPMEWILALAAQFDERIEERLERMIKPYYDRESSLISQNHSYGSQAVKSVWQEWREKKQRVINAVLDKHVVILPLFMYEHGGITMSTGVFSDRWDSGQVGWIYMTKETIRKEMCRPQPLKKGQVNPDLKPIKHVTNQDIERAIELLESEVKTYDQYLRNDVYGYVIEGSDGLEIDDGSCWGYYGEKDCIAAAKETVDYEIKYLNSPEYKEKMLVAEAEALAMIAEGALSCG